MFSTSEQLSRALWALCEANVSALTQCVNAAVEAGVNAAEVHADAVRGALASNTVLARQWLSCTESNTTPGLTGLQLEQ
jgi:hypothetical protein